MEETRGINPNGLPSLPAQLRRMLQALAEQRSDSLRKESESLHLAQNPGERGELRSAPPGTAEGSTAGVLQPSQAEQRDVISIKCEKRDAAADVYRANREAAFSLGLIDLSDEAGVRTISGGLTPAAGQDET